MQSRFLLVPAAIVVAAAAQPAAGVEVQTLEAAQQRLAPGAKLVPFEFRLPSEQYARLKAEYRVPALRPVVKGWRIEGGGWLFLDQVYGLNDIVTYLLAIDAEGKVSGLEILVCADGYCDLYTPQWRASFTGKVHGRWDPTTAAPMVSGATLSSMHVAEGVKKVLAIHARFMPPA